MARRLQIAPTRNRASLSRRSGTKTPRKVMLVVCEGETEKFYFDALREAHRLTRAEVVIPAAATGNDPLTLVDYAERREREAGRYDHIYCVFDRDTHASFGPAREKIRWLASKRRLPLPIAEAISIPCFEIWVLQHFQQTDRPFGTSAEVIAHLRAGPWPAYVKADISVAKIMVTRVDTAIANAKWLVARNSVTGSDNPFTNLHELAEKIAEMAGRS
jgi:hypothetical protein